MALSALHRVQGFEPSHLLFLSLHLSQALQTRFLGSPDAESVDEVLEFKEGWNFDIGDKGEGDIEECRAGRAL